MKYYILIFILLKSLITYGQTPPDDPHWQIVWKDYFNPLNPIEKSNGIDTAKWFVRNNDDHYGEPQMYRTRNATVSNGKLVLTLKIESYLGHSYTSGMVQTQPAYNIQYGYIEARIKAPYGFGFWPAFWTYTGNPSYQEVDIFELLPGREEYCFLDSDEHYNHNQTHLTSNIHFVSPIGFCQETFKVNKVSDYTNWHTYGLEWTPSKLIWYIDGSIIRISNNTGIHASTNLRINLALNPYVVPYNPNDFPQTMEIDYVKVYELDNDCNTDMTLCNYNFNTHDNKVKRNIVIGNGSCSNSLSYGDDIYLRASEGVLINSNFTVPIGSELYIDVNPCY